MFIFSPCKSVLTENFSKIFLVALGHELDAATRSEGDWPSWIKNRKEQGRINLKLKKKKYVKTCSSLWTGILSILIAVQGFIFKSESSTKESSLSSKLNYHVFEMHVSPTLQQCLTQFRICTNFTDHQMQSSVSVLKKKLDGNFIITIHITNDASI